MVCAVFACMHFALLSVDRPLSAYAGADLAFEIAKLIGAPLGVLIVTIAMLAARGSSRPRVEGEHRVEVGNA